MLYDGNCISCGRCFEICPQQAHRLAEGRHVIDYDLCVLCGRCVEVCHAGALRFSGKTVSVGEAMREIVQDKPYYDCSGGGVTLSGGEVFCQRDFARGLIEDCRARGIKTAVETNLYHDFDWMEPVLKTLDLIMFDIKLFDDEKHRDYTGVSNKMILDNALKTDELGVPLIVRTPLIPGITDGDDNLEATAEFVSQRKNALYYELLNFNPLGGSKYAALRRKNKFEREKPLPKKRLADIAQRLARYNIKIR